MSQYTNPYPTLTQQNADSIFVPVAWVSITKSDSTVYDPVMRGCWVGTTGDLAVMDAKGNITTIPGVLGGTLIPGYFQKIMGTNTTAGSLCAVY